MHYWSNSIDSPVPNSAIAFRYANSWSPIFILFIALTYSCTLQMVVVTCFTLAAVNLSWDTEVCRCETMAERMD
jgi:hypothetical protein